MPLIDRTSPTPFYQQVYEQIARGIEEGIYPTGKKLPSIRECARELGVSNTTIELAYQKLTEEGYVQARRGSGYTICAVESIQRRPSERFSEPYRKALEELADLDVRPKQQAGAIIFPATSKTMLQNRYDFAYDAVDPSLFPFTTWARISREVFFSEGAQQACLYNDSQGLFELREQIALYVNGEYGLACEPAQILVMPTTRDLIASIASLFDPAETSFAMENPGYDEVYRKLLHRGFDVTPIPIFPYPEWEDTLPATEHANIVFATPASQFPTNHAMSMDFRRRLVKWAKDSDAYVIDDEYGWEFQSGITRMPSLGVIDDSGHVITIGTFSNSFTPAVCLSYAILPPELMLKWKKMQKSAHPQVPWQTQAAMTTFMRDGHWRTHIRKMRTAMQRKRQTLIDALEKHMGERIDVLEGQCSLFALVRTKDGRSEDELVELAERADVQVYPTGRYWLGEPPDDWRYVLIGFAGISADSIEPGIEKLARAWGF